LVDPILEIVEVAPLYVRTVNAAGSYATRWGGFYDPRPEVVFDRDAPARLWPLEVGKSVAFVASTEKDSWM
jgi:hypothetical protein